MDREVIFEALKQSLQNMSLDEFASLFINETEAIEEFYKLCCGVKAGNTISLLFNKHRLDTDTITSPISIYRSLKEDNLLNGLARLYLYNLEHGVSNPFYQAVQRGYNGIQYVNEFPPIVARRIVLKFLKDNESRRILDPCCGWGGRMLGCASIPNTTYFGCEPSTKTHKGLLDMGRWIKTLQPSFQYIIANSPYEDVDITTGLKYDMALTSPPYYDTEHYSDEETNSLNRYKSFDEWCEKFYKPLILNTVEAIKEGGVFVLNVGERKYPLAQKMYEICEKVNLHCEELDDEQYLSGLGEAKERFYCISKVNKIPKLQRLF